MTRATFVLLLISGLLASQQPLAVGQSSVADADPKTSTRAKKKAAAPAKAEAQAAAPAGQTGTSQAKAPEGETSCDGSTLPYTLAGGAAIAGGVVLGIAASADGASPCPPVAPSIVLLDAVPASGSTVSIGACTDVGGPCAASPRLRFRVNYDQSLGVDQLYVYIFDSERRSAAPCFTGYYRLDFVCGGQEIEATNLNRLCDWPQFSTSAVHASFQAGSTFPAHQSFDVVYHFVP